MEKPANEKFRILVYGIERLNYPLLGNLSVSNNIALNFEPFDTKEEFQDYDGVILFHDIWAKWIQRSV